MNAPFGYLDVKDLALCIYYERGLSVGFCKADLYLSYDDDFPGDAVDKPGNMKMMTWLINEYNIGYHIKSCDNTIAFKDFQIAVLKIVDDETSPQIKITRAVIMSTMHLFCYTWRNRPRSMTTTIPTATMLMRS